MCHMACASNNGNTAQRNHFEVKMIWYNHPHTGMKSAMCLDAEQVDEKQE